MNTPSIQEVKALDGRVEQLLTPNERATLNFYLEQGRKFDVAIRIDCEVTRESIASATSADEVLAITNRATRRVVVDVGSGADAAWSARTTS